MSEPTNKTYRIRTVADLHNVPIDRLAICLMEIGAGIAVVNTVREKYQAMRAKLPWFVRVFLPRSLVALKTVYWIDDGKYTATINGRKISDDWVADAASEQKGTQ